MNGLSHEIGAGGVGVRGLRWLVPALKLVGALVIVTSYFAYAMSQASFVAVSPDTVRFMHFWQKAADQCRQDGGGAKQAVQAVCSAVVDSNNYDVHRGRYVQYAAYGVEAFTRGLLPSSSLNLWMMLLLTLNAGLIAWIATGGVRDPARRMSLFCLGMATLATTALTISPAILLNLYAKYLWLTFVLLFFAVRPPLLRGGCLAAAAFSDELGLFAAMMLVGMVVVHYLVARPQADAGSAGKSALRVLRACGWGALVALATLFIFYGVSAVLLNVGATGFRSFAYGNTQKLAQPGGLWSAVMQDLLWRAELLVFGTQLGMPVVVLVAGVAVLGLVAVGFWCQWRIVVLPLRRETLRWDARLRDWLGDRRSRFYTFWTGLLLLIVVLVLPRGAGDLTHYSYPAAVALAVLFLVALVDLCSARVAVAVLSALLVVHLCLAPSAVALASRKLEGYLLPDQSVTVADLRAINQSVHELKLGRTSATFDALNNGQELDFTGIWFYTRIGVQSCTGYSTPCFPVQGIVRVLIWPHPLPMAEPRSK